MRFACSIRCSGELRGGTSNGAEEVILRTIAYNPNIE
jgi:hypothetical protein